MPVHAPPGCAQEYSRASNAGVCARVRTVHVQGLAQMGVRGAAADLLAAGWLPLADGQSTDMSLSLLLDIDSMHCTRQNEATPRTRRC